MVVIVNHRGEQWAVILKKSVEKMLDDEEGTSSDFAGDVVKVFDSREDAEKYGRSFADENGHDCLDENT